MDKSRLQAYIHLFKFYTSNMQIGYAIRQHATFVNRKNLNVTTNFNHPTKGLNPSHKDLAYCNTR
jgi:hypothetical protein